MDMEIRYIIYLSHGATCRCFSERDLDANVRFALREGLHILGVERR